MEKTRLREILKQRMSIDQKAAMLPSMMNMQNSSGLVPPLEQTDASSSLASNHLYNSGGSGQQSFDSKDVAETTPQFKPRSHYAQPYYQSTGNNHNQQQQQHQQLPTTSQNSISQAYTRNNVTSERRQNSLTDNLHHQQQHGYNQNNMSTQPSPPPSRMNSNNDQYPGAGNLQNNFSCGGAGSGNRRSLGQNGGARQSLIDRSSTASHPVYHHNDDSGGGGRGTFGGGSQRRDSNSRLQRDYRQYDGTGEEDTDSSLRRNTKYVNRESLYSFQQVVMTLIIVNSIVLYRQNVKRPETGE